MPMPGETVSTEPVGPGVSESTEAVKPSSSAAASPSPPVAASPVFLSRSLSRIVFMASLWLSSGRCCRSMLTRWWSGRVTATATLLGASASFPSSSCSLAGRGGRIRQLTARLKLSPPPSASVSPALRTKRRRRFHNSLKRACQLPSPPAYIRASSSVRGRCRRASLCRHSHIHCQERPWPSSSLRKPRKLREMQGATLTRSPQERNE
mmetsp:Transcript_36310/g.107904  ORF Transcript_36310/g.107904 Transcript_36310/m.107904 type:complete len:208 (-) Transcript_36310:294-917(-)